MTIASSWHRGRRGEEKVAVRLHPVLSVSRRSTSHGTIVAATIAAIIAEIVAQCAATWANYNQASYRWIFTVPVLTTNRIVANQLSCGWHRRGDGRCNSCGDNGALFWLWMWSSAREARSARQRTTSCHRYHVTRTQTHAHVTLDVVIASLIESYDDDSAFRQSHVSHVAQDSMHTKLDVLCCTRFHWHALRCDARCCYDLTSAAHDECNCTCKRVITAGFLIARQDEKNSFNTLAVK